MSGPLFHFKRALERGKLFQQAVDFLLRDVSLGKCQYLLKGHTTRKAKKRRLDDLWKLPV